LGKPKKNKTQRFLEWRAKRDCELFRMARKQKKTLRSMKGARMEIASFSKWLANSKEIASFSEWLANRITLRTKKGARIEIARFQNGSRIENAVPKEKAHEWISRAFQNGSRVEIASFSEWLAN